MVKTTTTEFGIVCDKKDYNKYIKSSYMVGFAIGAMIFGNLADNKGKLLNFFSKFFLNFFVKFFCEMFWKFFWTIFLEHFRNLFWIIYRGPYKQHFLTQIFESVAYRVPHRFFPKKGLYTGVIFKVAKI